MRPNAEEILRGAQRALATYILPELSTPYAQTELMVINSLLGIAANQWDGAAQSLVDDNRALRVLAGRAADALAGAGQASLAGVLRSLAAAADPSLRISDLSSANAALRDALGRFAAAVADAAAPSLRAARAAALDHFVRDAEARSLHLLGPRADG